ncbi:MAG: tyrosine-type recombinase/integrase [Dorea sp.]|jgi:integrase/recombinase XerD|nr:tyrosine-type recombinase/integrase [Dorea sp.]
MKRYQVGMIKDVSTKYFYIRDLETMDIVELPTKYLTHMTRANRSPNTIRRNAFAICYYLEYMNEKRMELDDVYQMDYETQYEHFSEYLRWLKLGKHKENTKKLPDNGTCNAYLKDVFRFYLFLELQSEQSGQLAVLSYNQMTVPNSVGVKRTLRFKAFKGYLKEEERKVRAAEKCEIVTLLEACTNCRDQVLILLTSELGFRIGEILGIDYTKDIDYENREIRVDFRDDNENDARAKNAEERRGRISRDTFDFLLYYLSEYWDILQKQNYLFINIKGETTGKPMKVDSVYDMFERMEKKTGIKITPHMLRRYYANARWEADWPLEMISQALGHKHLDTTIRYLNVLDDKLKAASQEFYSRYSSLYGIQDLLDTRR